MAESHECRYKDEIVDFKHTLYGNGTPGLKVQFAEMKVKLNLILWAASLAAGASIIQAIETVFGGGK